MTENESVDWRNSLIRVSKMDLWNDKRFEREEWKGLLKEAENLLKNSRKKYSPDIVENILRLEFFLVFYWQLRIA